MGITLDNIISKNISTEIESSYIGYACSVLTDRAIPDIRDGLKPSQRRILISFNDLKLFSNTKHRKSALVTARCTGIYHPHGDQIVYPTMVRLAQDFSLRYPLVDGQGNFGNIGGSPAAAMRYTEVRMTRASEDILEDLHIDNQWIVPTQKNYDESCDEPTVLPSKFPNLLVNGSEGIAVGWATSIPPHNIREIVAGLIAVIRNPQLADKDLFKLITGPDFPNGGIIHGTNEIRKLYTTGAGHLIVTGRVEIENKKGGTATITVYELPYGTTTDIFLERADSAFKAGKLVGVSQLKDASSERMGHPVQVIFYLKRGEDPQVVLNQLYEHTPLKETYAGNLIALIEGKDGDRIPSKKPLTLRNLMDAWITFRIEVVTKRISIQLQAAKREIHRLIALWLATDPENIDKVVKIIKTGIDEADVIQKLMFLLQVDEGQAKNILDITLRRLMTLERAALQRQIDSRKTFAIEYEVILKDPKLISEVIIKELESIEKSYGDTRRTSIEVEMKKLDSQDLVPDEQVIVMMTHTGYIKRAPVEAYRKTSRGAKGVIGATTDDDDFVTTVFPASTHDWLLAFTNVGTVHWLKVFDIPESARATKGRALINLITLKEGEKVTSIIPVSGEFDEKREIIFGTAKGLVKKTKLIEYGNPRNGGIAAIKLNDGDRLIGAALTHGQNHILLVTEQGQAVRVNEEEIGSQGRNTEGRRGIKLKLEKDEVVAILCLEKDDPRYVLTFTKNGVGKRTLASDYPDHHCATSGVITSLVTLDPGTKIATAAIVREEDEVVIVSHQGKTVRIPASDIRISDRRTKGVRLINLEAGQEVVSAAVISKLD